MSTGRGGRRIFAVLLCGAVSVLCVYALELVFRGLNGIPIAGDAAPEEDGSYRVRTFRKSDNPLLVYELIPGAKSWITVLKS